MTHKNADKKPHQEPPKSKDSESSDKATLHAQSLFARIRRRALPILVSVGGTLILALQTYILHQQTGLIAKQTEALQLDQSAHLREHIVAVSEEEANVKRLLSSLESSSSFEINGDGLGGVVTVKNFSPDACANPHCSNASLSQALTSLSDDKPHLEDDVNLGLLRMAAFLTRVDGKLNSGLEVPKGIDMDKKVDKLSELRSLYTSGITQCFFDPGKARDLSEDITRIRLITSNAFFASLPLTKPDKYREMVKKFPQVGSNTKMGMIQMQAAAEDLMRAHGAGSANKDFGRTTYTFEEFMPVFAKTSQDAISGLRELDKQCNATISRDAAALKSMSVGSQR